MCANATTSFTSTTLIALTGITARQLHEWTNGHVQHRLPGAPAALQLGQFATVAVICQPSAAGLLPQRMRKVIGFPASEFRRTSLAATVSAVFGVSTCLLDGLSLSLTSARQVRGPFKEPAADFDICLKRRFRRGSSWIRRARRLWVS